MALGIGGESACGRPRRRTARLDNTPWIVRGIACGDIVAMEPDEEGVWWVGEAVRRSENCTIRRSRQGAKAAQPRCGQGVVAHRSGAHHCAMASRLRRLTPLKCPMAGPSLGRPTSLDSGQ
ncbi:DUF4265 domain-containing protein [Streptomyces tendae]|uniref:DUF4265 domain-containing protein n=1 Tax=Streptomyces tendae TaxID=1932 RepID=UPI0033C7EA9C